MVRIHVPQPSSSFRLAPQFAKTGETHMIDTSISCPSLVRVRQHLPRPRLANAAAVAARQVATLLAVVKPGAHIAITAGSRGIRDIVPILHGLGHADITTQALADAMDRHASYLNALTTGFVERVAIPMIMPTEQEAIAAALRTAGVGPPEARVVRIKNTLQLEDVWVSQNLVDEAVGQGNCEVMGSSQPLAYDANGRFMEG